MAILFRHAIFKTRLRHALDTVRHDARLACTRHQRSSQKRFRHALDTMWVWPAPDTNLHFGNALNAFWARCGIWSAPGKLSPVYTCLNIAACFLFKIQASAGHQLRVPIWNGYPSQQLCGDRLDLSCVLYESVFGSSGVQSLDLKFLILCTSKRDCQASW